MLAGDLAEAGVHVTVLERRIDESNVTRAFAVHARTMEELEIRGVADQLSKTGTTIRELRLFGRTGIDLARLPSEFRLTVDHSPVPDRAGARQAPRRTGCRSSTTCRWWASTRTRTGSTCGHAPATARKPAHRASYVVGADGVHSTVRTAIGLPFPGRSVVKSIMLADVRLSSPPDDALAVNGVGDGFALVAPFGDGWYRVFAWNRDNQVEDSAPLDLAEVRETTRRALGSDFGMHDPRWLSRFHSDERQVPTYRVGRVFLAGDAAHCHSPAGGQGMNTGIQDAANLGWKLVAASAGWGGEALLDSYHAERHPVGRQVLRSSGLLVRLALVRPRWARVARNTIAPALLRMPDSGGPRDHGPTDARGRSAAARPPRRIPGLGRYRRRVPHLVRHVLPGPGQRLA